MPAINAKKNAILLSILHSLKEIDPEFPIQYAICLAEIAENEGCSLTDLAEKTDLALSTVSRIAGALSDYRQRGAPYELIEMKISKTERRKKELFLTPKGRKTLERILSAL